MKKLTTLAALILSLTLATSAFAIIETPSGSHNRATDEDWRTGGYPGGDAIIENPSGNHTRVSDEDVLNGGFAEVLYVLWNTILP